MHHPGGDTFAAHQNILVLDKAAVSLRLGQTIRKRLRQLVGGADEAGDEGRRGVGIKRPRRADLFDGAAVQHHDPVRE